MALQILSWNGIPKEDFASDIRKLILEGRRKGNNLFLVGDEGCGKSFLFDPLEVIFKVLNTPASKYGWADIVTEELDVVYLNDFRWGPNNVGPDGTGIVEWDVLLRLLEGATVKLKRARNQYATDATVLRSNTIPIFGNGSEFIESISFGLAKQREQEMMNQRWKIYYLRHRIPNELRVHIAPCGACFARLTLLGLS